jgi:hypothetical protein
MKSLRKDTLVCFAIVVTCVWLGCTATATPVEQEESIKITGLSRATDEVAVIQPAPSHWERKVNGVYEDLGVSKIEKWADTYVLTINCKGIHSVYIQGTKGLNLDNYLGKFVRVQYTYVEVKNYNVKCIKAPCGPLIERKVVISNISEIVVSQADLKMYQTRCSK